MPIFLSSPAGISSPVRTLCILSFTVYIRYKSGFKGQGSFASWLFRIAHNAGIDHNLKLRRISNYKAEIHSNQDFTCEQNDLEKKEQHATLERAMSRLKQEEMEILVLGKIDCLKYKEIAEILNTTESNIKIRIYRALKKLKDIYIKLENSKYEKAGS